MLADHDRVWAVTTIKKLVICQLATCSQVQRSRLQIRIRVKLTFRDMIDTASQSMPVGTTWTQSLSSIAAYSIFLVHVACYLVLQWLKTLIVV
jgi:hypothetical protein